MKTYVVNLRSSADRREKIRKQLERLDISYELFQAIDGRSQAHPLFDRYNDGRRKRYKRYRLSEGELGCYASHFLLWEKCVRSGAPIVVMEDDVIVSSGFAEACGHAEKWIEKYGWIRMCGLVDEPFRTVAEYDQYRIIRYLKGPEGTQCYTLHPKTAEIFIKYSRDWFIPVDDFMDKFWLHGVDCIGLVPYAVQAGDNHPTIFRNNTVYDSLRERMIRRINRGMESLKRHCYNISAYWRRSCSKSVSMDC